MSNGLVGMLLDTLRLGAEPPPDLSTRWVQADLDRLLGLVAYEGAEIWLYRRLRALRILDTLPPPFQEALKTRAFETAARGLGVEAEAVSVLRSMSARGIPVVLIKGLARRALAPRYPYLDARGTNDVDLLLPADRIHQAYEFLLGNGYVLASHCSPIADHHHLPVVWNESRIGVELHSSTSARIPAAMAWARAVHEGEELEWGGLMVRVPPPTELACAAVAHALHESVVSGSRLQHFLEVSALVAGGAVVDWSQLMERQAHGEIYDEATGEAIPDEVVRRWLNGMIQLIGSSRPPESGASSRLDLSALLSWRLAVLDARGRLGRAFTERMLEGGPRALLGLGPETAPVAANGLARLRRQTAVGLSRMIFQTWNMARRR